MAPRYRGPDKRKRNRRKTPLAERFWPKVDRRGPDECWPWLASTNVGYGQICRGGGGAGMFKAHRVAYEFLVGPIPDGMDLDHLCRNPACVNPAHLEPVTHAENLRRGIGVAGKAARATDCPAGHPYDEANTHITREGTRKCRECNRLRQSRHLVTRVIPFGYRPHLKRNYGKAESVFTRTDL